MAILANYKKDKGTRLEDGSVIYGKHAENYFKPKPEPKQPGNRNNVLRALGDFLGGISRYDSSEHVGSAPERMRRATEDKLKGPAKGPFKPQ